MLVNWVGNVGLAPGISDCFTLFQIVDLFTIFAHAFASKNLWTSVMKEVEKEGRKMIICELVGKKLNVDV